MSWAITNARPEFRRHGPWLAVAAGAAVWAAVLVRLPGPAVTDPDGHASALYLERLVHGQRLEEPLLSTPKPLLTLTHGLAWTLTHDWRAATLLTILAFAVAATALARTAAQLGGLPTALAALVVTAGSGPLMLQVARGNSVVWAIAGWAVALAALVGPRRRWRLAGAALLAAGLARTETWLLLPLVALFVAVAWWRGARASCWLLLAFAAPLLWFGHDYLLTGDPLWSSKIPARYTDLIAGRHVVPPATWAADVARRYATPPAQLARLALALVGVAWLAARRAWLVLAGASALALGVLALLGWYAAQGVYISWRYFDPPDLAIRLLAAFGAAAIASAITTRLAPGPRISSATRTPPIPTRSPTLLSAAQAAHPPRHSTPASSPTADPPTPSPRPPHPEPGSDPLPGVPTATGPAEDGPSPRRASIPSPPTVRVWTGVATVLACLAAVAITWPIAPVDPMVDSTLDRAARLSANAATAIDALRPYASAGQPVSVSGPQRVRVALALNRPLDQIHDLFLDTLHTPLDQVLASNRAIYHDADGDRPADRFAPLTRITPGSVGSVRLRPILTNPKTGLYVLRIEPAGPADAAPPARN